MHSPTPYPSFARLRAAFCGAALALGLALVLSSAGGELASAHEGHDHGPPAPALPATLKPRIAVHSDTYELVAIANGQQLTIYLDRYASNTPVPDARIEIMAGLATLDAAAQPDSTFRATLPDLDKPGRHELVFNIQHKDGDDLLAGTLEVKAPGAATANGSNQQSGGWSLTTLILIGLGALAVGLALGRSSRLRVAVIAGAAVSSLLISAPDLAAHEGHDPSPVPSTESLTGDQPRRLADGSVFLPKPSQRLLSIRTELASEGSASKSITLVGRIISNPDRAGVVQSINGGRVEPLASGLPRLGQTVTAGQPLITVVPALPLADQSTLAERGRELEGQIRLGEQRLARLSRLTTGNVPRGQVEDVELEISNTRQRLSGLREARLQPETLVAPIDGIVSASRVVAGQVVQAQDILFQIVDPQSLWVEALVFDQLEPGVIAGATAVMADGQRMELKLEGRGRALQQQAVVLQFSIADPPANTVLGLPVTVIARRAETISGMLLPRDAVVRGSGGETIVWQHVDPERFVGRQVRFEPFDGASILVTGGIGPKDRIVVHGAELLSQVR